MTAHYRLTVPTPVSGFDDNPEQEWSGVITIPASVDQADWRDYVLAILQSRFPREPSMIRFAIFSGS